MSGRSSETLHLSPSEHHRAVWERTRPTLRYAGGDVRAWQRRLREKLRQAIGEMPRERIPLQVRTLWKRDHPLGTIEKIAFASEPFADVLAYVCLPRTVRPPLPFLICLQGHSTGMHVSIGVQRDDETQPYQAEGDRDFAIGSLKRGIPALCIEQRSFGERREQLQKHVSPHGCHDAALQALLLGRTLVGERVWDVDRGIDYLLSRGDVDPKRIGVMGNSGGGTVTLYAAALLPRLAFAMPSCAFCTFRDSILSIYHCADNYLPGIARYADMGDLLGLFAPKPVVVVAGRDDSIFPIGGARQVFEDLRRIYAAAGAESRCHLVVGNGGHRFYADDAWPALLPEIEALAAKSGGSHA